MCPDWELNRQPFDSQPALNPLSDTSQGKFVYFLDSTEGEGRERNIDVRQKTSIHCHLHALWLGIEPATRTCTLTGNQTTYFSVYRTTDAQPIEPHRPGREQLLWWWLSSQLLVSRTDCRGQGGSRMSSEQLLQRSGRTMTVAWTRLATVAPRIKSLVKSLAGPNPWKVNLPRSTWKVKLPFAEMRLGGAVWGRDVRGSALNVLNQRRQLDISVWRQLDTQVAPAGTHSGTG